jgi:predicted RNase H-like nuclease (RuvC/YqgF family)
VRRVEELERLLEAALARSGGSAPTECTEFGCRLEQAKQRIAELERELEECKHDIERHIAIVEELEREREFQAQVAVLLQCEPAAGRSGDTD